MKLNLPRFWRGMGWTEKAAYLCRTHQARDFADACAILRAMPRKKKPAPKQVSPDYWYLKD
jgi:hypothetical protein